jgi:SAM-dependent methyltransferase
MTKDYVPQVREQYEGFPYPPRDPDDDRKRLVMTRSDDLALVNHYCFAGRETFRNGFRVLVAGGGTGDATIYLAEQLRHTDAEIVHVDLSRASMEIAQRRAAIRELDNIVWVHESLLGLPALGLEKFDYINCIGVLHHLEDPDEGLRALLAVLKDTGALGIMVYAKYGRTGVYQMQTLMRLVDPETPGTTREPKRRIAVAREVLACLPATNWFKRGEELITDPREFGDTGIYDVFLHARDRAYTVGELYEWIHDQHRLYITMTPCAAYLPEMVIGPERPRFLERVREFPLRRQYEIAELLTGRMIMHTFYATRMPGTAAPYGDADCVPFFFHDSTAADLAASVKRNPGQLLMVNHPEIGVPVSVNPGRFGGHVLNHVDGQRSFGEIFQRVRAGREVRNTALTDGGLFEDFRSLFEFLNTIDRILLRHRSVMPVSEHSGLVWAAGEG